MATRGRKRKPGKRTKSGQLSRANAHDYGNDKARLKQSIYGSNGTDAIGRAFVKGLLGEHGSILLDTGRAIGRAYWPIFGTGRVRSALGESWGVSTSDGNIDAERWLTGQLETISSMGHAYRLSFDQFVIDPNPDYGPDWLDRIIEGKGTGRDLERLDQAKIVLEVLAGIRTFVRMERVL
jgi:hypothetical protein